MSVKEIELKSETKQIDMSQGMFRALSLLIQLNYNLLSTETSTILVDDIGEGLDYERGTKLIKIIIEKTLKSSTQLIASTNDRFIMNSVPLEYWIILARKNSEIRIITKENSKKLFDEFEETGLNNFDFFSSNYYSKELDNT